jgi:hypothetical protein
MKYRNDRPEESCPKVLPELGFAEHGGIVCMRIAGHEGPCEAAVLDAAALDGVCWGCRNALGSPHEPGCVTLVGDDD